MAEIRKVLGQSNPAAATLTTLYTVPSSTQAIVSTLTVVNRSGGTPTGFRLSVAVAGAADSLEQYLYYDLLVPATDTFTATLGVTLGATDVVRVYATLATLSFNLYGIELT